MSPQLGSRKSPEAGHCVNGTRWHKTRLSNIEGGIASSRCRASGMARYQSLDTIPQFLSVDLARQLLPCTFVYAASTSSPRSRPLPDLVRIFFHEGRVRASASAICALSGAKTANSGANAVVNVGERSSSATRVGSHAPAHAAVPRRGIRRAPRPRHTEGRDRAVVCCGGQLALAVVRQDLPPRDRGGPTASSYQLSRTDRDLCARLAWRSAA